MTTVINAENKMAQNIETTTIGNITDGKVESMAVENIESGQVGNIKSRMVESIESINEDDGLEIVPFPCCSAKPKKPYVGMIFSSIQEAEVSYQDYGRENGFIIRRRSTYKAQRGRRVTRVLFTCSCEGLHKKKGSLDEDGKTKKNRSTMRTNCKAMMRIIWDRETNDWVVNDFTDDHNHVMVTATKRVLMGSRKYMPHSIMTKWMKDANRNEIVVPDDLLMHDCLVGTEAMRISDLCRRSTQLAYLAGRSEEGYKIAMDILDQAFEKVKQLDNVVPENENAEKPFNEKSRSVNDVVILPPVFQEKGIKRVKKGKDKAFEVASDTNQLKSGTEILEANKKPRVCKTCSGQGHDSRNCKEKAKNKEIDSNDPALSRNGIDGVEVIQTTNGVEAIQTTNGVEANQTMDGVETIQTTDGVEGIQTDGVEGIQTTDGVEGILATEG